MVPILWMSSLMRACGSRKVTPVPDASRGYAFGSPQSSCDDVRRDPRDLRRGHGFRHVALARGSLIVHRRDDAGVVDRPHARHRLVDVAAVVTGGDLDAGAVRATSLVERGGGHLQCVRLVLQRQHGRFEDGHEADLERRLRRVARPVVPQSDSRVVDRLGLGPARGVAARVVVVAAAARRRDERQRREHRKRSAKSSRHRPAPPSCGRRRPHASTGFDARQCISRQTSFAGGISDPRERRYRGMPRMRSAIRLRWICDVPAAIVYCSDQR